MMELYVIYHNPTDFPGRFVVRRHVVKGGVSTPDTRLHDDGPTLESVRESLPSGLTNVGRFANDDPCIVEVWL